MASSSASETAVALEARGFAHVYAGASRASVADVDLVVGAGECVWLRGASGSGKSTLLRGLAGVLPPGGRSSGRVCGADRPALLFQDVESQLLCTTVAEEVELALRERAVATAERRARTREALGRVGLAGFERRSVDSLSAGEKQRVVLAALLALRPRVLLLDEPASALDPPGRRALAGLLRELKARGHALVIADHTPDVAAAVTDRWLALDAGRPTNAAGFGRERRPPVRRAAIRGEPLLRCEGVAVADPSGRMLVEGVTLRVRRGERWLVTGPNGAGKSTLLRAAAGILPLARGEVSAGPPARDAVGIGLLFQDPQRHLFARTVGDEVAFGLRRRGIARHALRSRVAEVLARCALDALADRSPLRLSFGEQIRTALAATIAPRPGLLLLDEPFAGLDAAARAELVDLLSREQATTGAALVVASHDARPWEAWCDHTLRLAAGRPCDG